MQDGLVTLIDREHGIEFVVADVSETSRHAEERHMAGRIPALSMAMTLTGTALLSGDLQDDEKRSAQINFNGELRTAFAEVDGQGHMRAYAVEPSLPKLDPSRYDYVAALGTEASITVIWSRAGKTLSVNTTEVQKPTLREEFNAHMRRTDTPVAAVELCADYRNDGIKYASGILARVLPGGDEAYFEAEVRPRFDSGDVFEAMCSGKRMAAIARVVFSSLTLEETGRRALEFKCPCSRERVLGMLRMLGREQIGEMLVEQGRADITCMFCNTGYGVDEG